MMRSSSCILAGLLAVVLLACGAPPVERSFELSVRVEGPADSGAVVVNVNGDRVGEVRPGEVLTYALVSKPGTAQVGIEVAQALMVIERAVQQVELKADGARDVLVEFRVDRRSQRFGVVVWSECTSTQLRVDGRDLGMTNRQGELEAVFEGVPGRDIRVELAGPERNSSCIWSGVVRLEPETDVLVVDFADDVAPLRAVDLQAPPSEASSPPDAGVVALDAGASPPVAAVRRTQRSAYRRQRRRTQRRPRPRPIASRTERRLKVADAPPAPVAEVAPAASESIECEKMVRGRLVLAGAKLSERDLGCLRAAAKNRNEFSLANETLAFAYRSMGKANEAFAVLEHAVTDPLGHDDPDLLLQHAEYLVERRDFARAARQARKAHDYRTRFRGGSLAARSEKMLRALWLAASSWERVYVKSGTKRTHQLAAEHYELLLGMARDANRSDYAEQATARRAALVEDRPSEEED